MSFAQERSKVFKLVFEWHRGIPKLKVLHSLDILKSHVLMNFLNYMYCSKFLGFAIVKKTQAVGNQPSTDEVLK